MMEKYWQQRLEQIANSGFDSADITMQKMAAAYSTSAKRIEYAIADLYEKMASEGVSPSSLYKYDRYTSMRNAITQEMTKLGIAEKSIMELAFSSVYDNVSRETAATIKISFSLVPKQQLESVLRANWAGRNFSDSIWNNKAKLTKQLEQSLVDVIATGRNKDAAVKEIMDTLGKGYRDADRLVRTETNFFVNQAQKNIYMEAGFKEYKILAEIDGRTSDICREQNGKTYPFSQATVGVNMSPFHVNCRTTIVPVLES